MRIITTALLTAVIVCGGSAAAGVSFRLDVGQSFADTSGGKFKDAVLLVRGLACDAPASIVMTGTAEGVVDGARQSVPLALSKLATPGVFAVRRQWPDGRWVLNVAASCPGRKAEAGVLVPLDGASKFIRSRIQHFERRATGADVEAALKATAE